jgi:uncharacterized membrane protein
MIDPRVIARTAINYLLTIVLASILAQNVHAHAKVYTEKCYGIAKAGMNDCRTSDPSCASSSTKDNQLDAFIFLPKGVCERIIGGSLLPKVVSKEDKKG